MSLVASDDHAHECPRTLFDAGTIEAQDISFNNDNLPDTEVTGRFQEGGYGWVVVVCVTFVQAHTYGFNSAFSVFLAYYLESNAFPEATSLEFAFIAGLSFALSLFVSPLVTATIRLFGTHVAFFFGVIIQTAGFVSASFSTRIWHLVLSQGLAVGIGMGFCYTATTGLVTQWFVERRALANGIATSGTGLGGLVYALAASAMIEKVGLAWTFRIFAIIGFVVLSICGIFLRDRNKSIGSIFISFDWFLFRRAEFWLLLGWIWFSNLAYLVVLFSIADYVQHVGFTAAEGSIAAAMFSLSTAVGRPFYGICCDQWGIINMTSLATLLNAASALILWIFAGPHYAGAIVYSLFGVFTGIIWATLAPIAAQVVGLQLLPSALSIIFMTLVLPCTFAEAIGLSLRRAGKNGYLYTQIFVGIVYIFAFICIWLLRSWKIFKMTKNNRER